MIANDAPRGTYGTAQRFKEAALECGYHFQLTELSTDGGKTRAEITNTGVAPIYRDAFLAVGGVRGAESLKGLLPGKTRQIVIEKATDGRDVTIESDFILPGQTIQFDADL